MIWDCPFCFLGWLHDQWGWDREMAEKFIHVPEQVIDFLCAVNR